MPESLKSLEVIDLFGRLHHCVQFRLGERVTILTGPNGSGKTHLLNILRAMTALEFATLAQMPFGQATVCYASGRKLSVTRSIGQDELMTLDLIGTGRSGMPPQTCQVSVSRREMRDILPRFMEQIEDELWVDNRDGELVSHEELLRRFPRARVDAWQPRFAEDPQPPAWLQEFGLPQAPTMIATRRLDVDSGHVDRMSANRRATKVTGPIGQYARRIEEMVSDARRSSLAASQRAEGRFAARALDRARASVKESELRSRYEIVASQHQELYRNGLTEESTGVSFPAGRTNPTERRILNTFIDDWEKRLQPLLPVNERLEIFRTIVSSKMRDKTIDVSGGELRFASSTAEPIAAGMLSSGEQHLVALFAMLLFDAKPGSLVLIDEPEISLHASWKHSFLPDVRSVARLNDLTIVLATHSTAIVNGEWNLVEELAI